jgi:large subunit ribosomal protein L14e
MSVLDVGRICIKTLGREIGAKCVIVDVIDKSFVLLTGPKELTGVKRRRANVKHLEITKEAININRGASDEDIISALKETGKLEEMKAPRLKEKS